MTRPKGGSLLPIFIGESDRHAGMLLYEWIVRAAREHGLAGATVLRGVEGFGGRSRVRTAKILDLSTDLPIVIEIVDTLEKIEAFLPIIDDAILDAMATSKEFKFGFIELENSIKKGIECAEQHDSNVRIHRFIHVGGRL